LKSERLKNKSSQVYPEEELITGCAEGNSICRRIVYERFLPKMLGICMRYAANREQAEDMVHEGFIRVFLNIGKFRKESSLETWMTRVMVNSALDALRKETHNVLYRSAELVEENELEETNHEASDAYNADNEEQVSSEDIILLMQKLPAGYRAVLNMYALEDMSHKEIATQLGISEGTSKSQLAKARAFLKKLLDKKKLVTHER
jgi:RNA polymerase sigma-70 factor (ECF subfamily)